MLLRIAVWLQRQDSIIRPDLCQTELSNQDAAHTFRSCFDLVDDGH